MIAAVFHEIASILETLIVRLPIFFVLWTSIIGACIGSFMNVVIFRLPAGLNIAYPPSRCPKCEQLIRGFDNIPILSWFLLKGKCRHCGLPIAIRYPLVEALHALVFGCLSVSIVTSDTAIEQPVIICIHGMYFGVGFACLLAMTAIQLDGHDPPKSLVLWTAFTLFAFSMGVPGVRREWAMFDLSPEFFNAVLKTIAGFLMGFLISKSQSVLPKTSNSGERQSDDSILSACFGAMVGWPTAFITLTCTIVFKRWDFRFLGMANHTIRYALMLCVVVGFSLFALSTF